MKLNPPGLPPQIAAALAAEATRRGLNWLNLAAPLCGTPSTPITPRAILELTLAGNPLVTGHGLAHRRHVYDVLWRLHPAYARPGSPGRIARALRAWWLRRRVWRLNVTTAAAQIRQRILAAYLDSPSAPGDPTADRPSALRADPYWLDGLVEYIASRYGWPPAVALDLPLAQIFQLRRAAGLAAGEDIIDPVHEQLHTLLQPRSPRGNPKSQIPNPKS